jgi:hypothetical protein
MGRDMNTHMKTGGTKSPKSPNPLTSNWLAPAPNAGPCSKAFSAGMNERLTKYPFRGISAYKVRESLGNIERIIATVMGIIDVVSSGEVHSPPILLGSCTSEDKAKWLKDLPSNLARELGYNLIPAIEALWMERVPEAAITSFIQSIKSSVFRVLTDCDAVQAATSRSINGEYQKMKAGCSEILRICQQALAIAEQAVALCEIHGV